MHTDIFDKRVNLFNNCAATMRQQKDNHVARLVKRFALQIARTDS
jgi:hypothetical protein